MKLSISAVVYLLGFGGALVIGLLEGIGFMPSWAWLPWVLVVIGLLIGIMNVSESESNAVMIAALVLGLGATSIAMIPMIGGVLAKIAAKIAYLSIPVAIPVAVMTLAKKLK